MPAAVGFIARCGVGLRGSPDEAGVTSQRSLSPLATSVIVSPGSSWMSVVCSGAQSSSGCGPPYGYITKPEVRYVSHLPFYSCSLIASRT